MRISGEKEFSEIWPLISGVVDKHGGYSEEDILECIKTGEMQAHVYDNNGIKMASITEIRQFPRNRVLSILFAGGTHIEGWKDTIKQYFEDFAKLNHCDEMQVIGRLGWARIFPETRTAWAIYRHRIDK